MHRAQAHFKMNPFRFPETIPSKRSVLIGGLLVLLFVLAPSRAAMAQIADDVVRTETTLVQLNVGVVDRQGRSVTYLSRNEFSVFEDGVKQTILHFDPTEAPFSLIMLLDMSGSTINFRQQLKQAAFRFLDALAPEDRVEVISFNARVKTLAGFSTNRKKTAYAIQIAEGAGETHFYEALKYSLRELEREGKRRKAIVVLTDGLDTQLRNTDRSAVAKSQTDQEAIASIMPEASQSLKQVLNEAARQGVTIYPLALPSGDPKRLPLPDPVITGIYSAARARLQALADRTGGRLNAINRLDDLARVYAEVAADLRSLYTVAYQPPTGSGRSGKWHEIRVELTRPELIVRTRPGYYAR
jgi:Ca-activated chloride channel homolog